MSESALTGSTMENGGVIVRKDGIVDKMLPEGFDLIGRNDSYIIASSLGGEVLLKEINGKEIYKTKMDVRGLSASYNGKSHLALLLSNNETVIIDITQDKVVFKEKSKHSFTTTSDIASPLFADGLVVFPTLDGKLVVVDENKLTFIRDFIVGQQQFFSNIIHLQEYKGRIIAATSENIYSIGDEDIKTLERDVRFLTSDKENLYLFSIDGQIEMLSETLEVEKKKKVSFARYVGVSFDENYLYVVEHSGYVIKLSKDLEKETVYGIPDDIDDYIFMDKNIMYYSRKILIIE